MRYFLFIKQLFSNYHQLWKRPVFKCAVLPPTPFLHQHLILTSPIMMKYTSLYIRKNPQTPFLRNDIPHLSEQYFAINGTIPPSLFIRTPPLSRTLLFGCHAIFRKIAKTAIYIVRDDTAFTDSQNPRYITTL